MTTGACFTKLLQLQNCRIASQFALSSRNSATFCFTKLLQLQNCRVAFATVAIAELQNCGIAIAELRKKVALIRNSATVAKKISHHKSWCEKKLQFCNSLEKTQLM